MPRLPIDSFRRRLYHAGAAVLCVTCVTGAVTAARDIQQPLAQFSTGVQLVEVYATPYVKAEEHLYYGHGLWIEEDTGGPPEIYVVGGDAGVSFKSRVNRDDLQVTVISNTSNGAWPVLREIRSALKE